MCDSLVTAAAGLSSGSPGMPYRVAVLPFGTEGRTRPAKVFADGRPGEYLTDDEIAVWEHVRHLEQEREAFRTGSPTPRVAAQSGLPSMGTGAAVEEIVTALPDGIEAATVTETTVPMSDADVHAWVGELLDGLPEPVPSATLEPGLGTADPGNGLPVDQLGPPVPTPEWSVVPTTPPAVPEVRAGEPVPAVGTEPAVPKTAKRLAVEAALKESPQLSNAVIGDRCEVSAEFVRVARKQLEAAGALEPVTSVIGRDGTEQAVGTRTGAA